MSLPMLEALTTTTSHVVARVDLLPPGLDAARRFRKVQLGLGASLVAVVALVAAASAVGAGNVATAEEALTQEQFRSVQLRGQLAQYAEAPQVVAEVEAAQAARRAVSAFDVSWFGMLDAIAAGTPASTTVASLTLGLDASATAPGGTGVVAPTNPLGVPGVGTVSIIGTAPSQDAVATLLEGLARVPGVANPLVTSSTAVAGTPGVSFASTATITPDALLNQQ